MSHAKKKSSTGTANGRKTNDWGGWFVHCDIPKEHLDRLKVFEPDYDRLSEWEQGMVQAGRKLSISFNAEKKSFVASATDTNSESPTYKGTLSAFAPTYWAAKLALWWKHEEILGGDWGVSDKHDPEWG